MSDVPDLLSRILVQQEQILDELRASRQSVLETRGTALEARFAAFVTATETRLGAIDTRLDAIDQRLSGDRGALDPSRRSDRAGAAHATRVNPCKQG